MLKKKSLIIMLMCMSLLLCACSKQTKEIPNDKYRTYYEIFVYSFYDSDNDGVGDLQGVCEKIDYLKELGITGIWLMPVMPSTTYHKYDTTDYTGIDSEYGNMEEFEKLISMCHENGIRVIIDLAMNHSSSKHPWFMEATSYLRNLPEGKEPDVTECPYFEYYNFSKEASSGYANVAGTDWYYEANFWSEMPDLNLKNETVMKEFEAIAKFWLDKGVDGFRLDAVKEYVSGSYESNTEILATFNEYVKSVSPEAYIVCECWMNKDEYAKYYASGVDSMFDFDYADKSGVIANVLNGKANALSYAKFMVENEALYAGYNEDFINAPFYTNHDMGRSAGYYAGEDSEAKTKMGNAMNILMGGNVFLYYGEELGMKGSGKDENKRAPMYWSKDSNAQGMCDGPADMDDFDMKFESLTEQSADENSIFNYVKKAIFIRNSNPEIARGTLKFYEEISDESVCVISRTYNESEVFIVLNVTGESASVNVESLGKYKVIGELLTNDESVVYEKGNIVMPKYSVVILEEK